MHSFGKKNAMFFPLHIFCGVVVRGDWHFLLLRVFHKQCWSQKWTGFSKSFSLGWFLGGELEADAGHLLSLIPICSQACSLHSQQQQ